MQTEIEVNIRTITKVNFMLSIRPCESVKSLKDKIYEKMGLAQEMQTLLFSGETLLEDKTLEEYGIADKCVIFVVATLVGGY